MKSLPKITDKTIRQWVGETSMAKGDDYYRDGCILNPRRQGMTLQARCEGQSGGPYRVEATLDKEGIADAECSCPVGDGGRCKHVAALLLTWKNRPKDFTEVEETEAALEKRSREELIALIKLMLRREPDLAVLLDAPLPGVGKPGKQAKPEAYRRQAELAFRRDTSEWGYSSEVARELNTVLADGKEFLAGKDFAGATAVYLGVLEGVLDAYEPSDDQEGDLFGVVGSCVFGLAKCLEAVEDDTARRQAILRALFDVVCLDLEQGGVGLSDEVPDFTEVCTPDERRMVTGWVREAMGSGDDDWSRKHLGSLLLDLEADVMDDATYLRVCRETGQRHALVKRLLQLGRVDEAAGETETASEWELINLADLFVRERHGDVADRLVQERASKRADRQLLDWLKKRAARRRDTTTVLELSEKLFRSQPTLEGYKELKKLAEKQGTWAELEPKLLSHLQGSKRDDVLIRIYLEKGEIDKALEAVKDQRISMWGYGFGMKLEVARAAEKTRPRAALDIYRQEAEAYIAGRHREAYATACRSLKKVRDLYRQVGDEASWAKYVAGLRTKHASLRALMDEMNKAKL